MKNVYLYMGKRYSKGGVAVAEGLGIKWCKTKVVDYIAKDGDTIINWGTSLFAPRDHGTVIKKQIQHPNCVAIAANKLSALLQLNNAHISVPNFTTRKLTVIDSGGTWFARHSLTGSGGKGIEIIKPGDKVPDAPLYTKYIKSDYEIRVHVGGGKAFDIQQKMKKKDAPPDELKGMVKNHDRGYVFVRNNIDVPARTLEAAKQQAVLACGALGLDFGAVDVITKDGVAYVLEVNTSPGLEGTTLENYIVMLRGLINGN